VQDQVEIEQGIRPLVEAANAAGYVTVSSCEGHADEKPAGVVFIASNDKALRVHHAIRQIDER